MQVATETTIPRTSDADLRAWADEVRDGLHAGKLAPYLGPGVLTDGAVPASDAAVAKFLGSKVALPKRARGNMWASAQYIESRKHRQTLDALLSEVFGGKPTPTALHSWLAAMPLPLIVDSWYDGSMRAALGSRSDWVEVQGSTRVAIGEDRWWRSFDPAGTEVDDVAAAKATTVLYKPHGSVSPAGNFLISDSDYVEVLTEIDIQTPIPPEVKQRRTELGFVYLGCRFHEQTLRIFARQIGKRSEGPRFAVVDPSEPPTTNETRFLAGCGAKVVHAPLAEAVDALTRA